MLLINLKTSSKLCPTANSFDEEAAKEEGRHSDGHRQPGYSAKAKKQKAEGFAL